MSNPVPKAAPIAPETTRLTAGKARALQQMSTSSGAFAMLALDHSDSMAELLETDRASPDPALMTATKLYLCRALAPSATAVLLDPIYGAAQAILSRALPGTCGLIVTLEDSGYEGRQWEFESKMIEGWSVRKIKIVGAQAVKLLIYYNPTDKSRGERQRSVVKAAVEQCALWDIPLLVEPIVYPAEDEGAASMAFLQKRPDLIIETARQMTALGIDILKAEFPANPQATDMQRMEEACRELDRASSAPWVILSAGVGYDQFRLQVHIACKNGASGFLAGRSLWAASAMAREEQARLSAMAEAAQRFQELREIAEKTATPWYSRSNVDLTPPAYGWHRQYAQEE